MMMLFPPLTNFTKRLAMICAAALVMTACASPQIIAEYPEKPEGRTVLSGGSILDNFRNSEGGFSLGGSASDNTSGGGAALNANSDLWQASLDSLAFLPLASANPEGGVIITDWYEDNATQAERTRFKVNVVIIGKELRADSLRVSVFTERRQGNEWRSQTGATALARQLENIILARARDLKLRRLSR